MVKFCLYTGFYIQIEKVFAYYQCTKMDGWIEEEDLPRVRSTCGKGFELKFWRVPVAAWAVGSYSNSQPATGIPQIINSDPLPTIGSDTGYNYHRRNK